jgi:hypothetical protein
VGLGVTISILFSRFCLDNKSILSNNTTDSDCLFPESLTNLSSMKGKKGLGGYRRGRVGLGGHRGRS